MVENLQKLMKSISLLSGYLFLVSAIITGLLQMVI